MYNAIEKVKCSGWIHITLFIVKIPKNQGETSNTRKSLLNNNNWILTVNIKKIKKIEKYSKIVISLVVPLDFVKIR